MRMTATGLAAAAVLALAGSLAHADPYFAGPPTAPAAGNLGFYAYNGCCWYGPNHCPRPPFPPFNGLLVPLQPCPGGFGGGPGVPTFATHPFVRSPRDFFMFGQTYND